MKKTRKKPCEGEKEKMQTEDKKKRKSNREILC